ncbi:FtsX-like permease family protein [Fusibacter sp. JL216-2]|uniref:FtsX-like permease family protein n=1 Tax=Fusibacter sp. JL216-2 TaxID=3071453 RepID=UPI003D326251
MSLYFKLISRNVIRNAKLYSAYFTSMTLSVMIYFVLKSMELNDTVVVLSEYYQNIQSGIVIATTVVTIAVTVLVLYSNMFFIKRRKREIGLYALVGMPHRKIARIVAMETLIASLVSLTVGLLAGILVSKLNFYVLLRLLDEKVYMEMPVNMHAVLNTVMFFGGISLITLVSNAFIVYRVQLIELFRAESKNEKHIGNPTAIQVLMGGLSIACLGVAYYLALRLVEDFTAYDFYTSFGLVVLGTFGVYIYGMPMLLRLVQKRQKYYYKKYNMIIMRQVSHNVLSNSKMLAIVTLLVSCTLGAMSVTLGLYDSQLLKSDLQAPVSYIIEYGEDDIGKQEVDELLQAYKEDHPVVFHEHLSLPIAESDVLRTKMLVMPKSKYNRILGELDLSSKAQELRNEANINGNQALLVSNIRRRADGMDEIMDKALELGQDTVYITQTSPLGVDNEFMSIMPTLVVDDAVYKNYVGSAPEKIVRSYILVDNHKRAKDLTGDMKMILGDEWRIHYSHYVVYKRNLADKATVLFIGVYVGLIFLIASGSTLSIKQLTGALRDKKTFSMLKNMGINERGIREILSKQIAVNFFVPVLLSAVHLIFALNFVASVYEQHLGHAIGLSTATFMFVYLLYYMSTVQSYYKIVNTI